MKKTDKEMTAFENRVIETFRSANPDMQAYLTNDLMSDMLNEAKDTCDNILIKAKLGLQQDIGAYKAGASDISGQEKVTLNEADFQKMKSGQIKTINTQIDSVKQAIEEKEEVFIVSDDNVRDLAKDYGKLEGLLEARQDFYKEYNPDRSQEQQNSKDRLSGAREVFRRASQRASLILPRGSQGQAHKSDKGQAQDTSAQKGVEVQTPKK